MLDLLAQSTSYGSSGYGQVVLWGGLLIGLAIVGGAIWLNLRRRLFEEDEGFSIRALLDELEDARAQGMMSEEEFQRARNSLLGIKQSAPVTPDVSGSGPEDESPTERPDLPE